MSELLEIIPTQFGFYAVKNLIKNTTYCVTPTSCNCPGQTYRKNKYSSCKHMKALQEHLDIYSD